MGVWGWFGDCGVLFEHVDPDEAHGSLIQVVVVDACLGEIEIVGKLIFALPCLLDEAV